MPTNEERQIVTYSLRNLASYREVNKELVEDVLGLYMGECVDGYDPVSVVHVADLIEPEPKKTCKWQGYACVGTLIRFCNPATNEHDTPIAMYVHFLSCGHKVYSEDTKDIPIFCPNCGAEVIEE